MSQEQKFNEKQEQAIRTENHNVLVLAGAGSGKTRVLVHRIAWLVQEQGLSSEAILALTFSNKAAHEMKIRTALLLGAKAKDAWIETFHGFAHRLLRRHHYALGLSAEFCILDGDDQGRLLKKIMSNLHLDPKEWPVKRAMAYINKRKDEGLRAKAITPPSYGATKILHEVYLAYEKACLAAAAVDFADLLLYAHELLSHKPAILAHYRRAFRAILIDEFQDSSPIQYQLMQLLADEGTFLMAVGDDDQLIYSWRGAKLDTIQRFSGDFKNTQLIKLEQNYRSSATILQAANALIENNVERMGKTLWTKESAGKKIILYAAENEFDEAHFVAQEIAKALKERCMASEIAVLYRTNAQSRLLETAFLSANIAYKIHGGLRFFERAEIKDSLAYLRLLVNPNDDIAFERIINFPTRGIGEKTLDNLRAKALEKNLSFWQAAVFLLENKALDARAAEALGKFTRLIEQLKADCLNLDLEEQVELVIKNSGIYQYFTKIKSEKFQYKLENLQELIKAANEFIYEEENQENTGVFATLVAFLAHVSLESGSTEGKEAQAYVQLMTLHAAKGLEFSNVFLVGLEEGTFPSSWALEADKENALEEERRLCYVGITRAKESLILSYSKTRFEYHNKVAHKVPCDPSCFLSELPPNLIEERRSKMQYGSPVMGGYSPAAASSHKKIPQAPASYTREKHASGLSVGQKVLHSTFGQGVLKKIEGEGAQTKVEVDFVNAVSKCLLLAYANLVLLDS